MNNGAQVLTEVDMRTMLLVLAIAAATLSGIVDGSGPQEATLGLLVAFGTAMLRRLVKKTVDFLGRPWKQLAGRIPGR